MPTPCFVAEAYRLLADYEYCWWHCNIVHGYYDGTGLIAIDTDTVACSKCVASKKRARKGWFSGDDALDRGENHCYVCWDKGAPVKGTESNRFIKQELVLTNAGKGMRKGSDKGLGSGKSDDGEGFDKGKDFDKSSGSGKSDDGKGFDKGSGKSDSGKGFHWRDDSASQGQGLPLTHTLTGLPWTPASRTPARVPASRTPARAAIDSGKSDDVSSADVQSDDGTYVVKGTGTSSSGDVSSDDSTDTSSSDRSRSPQRLTRTQPSVPSEIHQDVATERPSSEDIKNTLAYLSEVLAVRSR